jgi:hypothetical protein
MSNNWVSHLRDFAKKNNISYGCAISNPQAKASYLQKYPTPEIVFDEYVDASELTQTDAKRWLKAFKTVLREHNLLRVKLTADAVEKYLTMADNLAFKPSAKAVMKLLTPLLERSDVADFRKAVTQALAAVGHVESGTPREVINQMLEANGYRPIEASGWRI